MAASRLLLLFALAALLGACSSGTVWFYGGGDADIDLSFPDGDDDFAGADGDSRDSDSDAHLDADADSVDNRETHSEDADSGDTDGDTEGEAEFIIPRVAPMISAGNYHTCMTLSSGEAYCWGNNDAGQLGNGTTTHEPVYSPSFVVGLPGLTRQLSAGWQNSCALTTEGSVFCWGYNMRQFPVWSQPEDPISTPVKIAGLSEDVTALSLGSMFACALTHSGSVYCWGENGSNQLGDGTSTDRLSPVAVIDLPPNVIAVSTGASHACAMTGEGDVVCWGGNQYGQIGDASNLPRSSPVHVKNLSDKIIAISAGGYHSCALTRAGTVQCWGNNAAGELGVNIASSTCLNDIGDQVACVSTPQTLGGFDSAVVAISAGMFHTCALTRNGTVYCWGYNEFGQVGDGTLTNVSAPKAISGISGSVLSLTAGAQHTCVIVASGSAYCWGDNQVGQLGDGTTITRLTPQKSLW